MAVRAYRSTLHRAAAGSMRPTPGSERTIRSRLRCGRRRASGTRRIAASIPLSHFVVAHCPARWDKFFAPDRHLQTANTGQDQRRSARLLGPGTAPTGAHDRLAREERAAAGRVLGLALKELAVSAILLSSVLRILLRVDFGRVVLVAQGNAHCTLFAAYVVVKRL